MYKEKSGYHLNIEVVYFVKKMPGLSIGTFSSPHKKIDVEVGCYKDVVQQAMPNWVFGNTWSTFQQCKQGAIDKRYVYFALQNVGSDYRGVCFASNDIIAATRFGATSNYTREPGTGKGLGLNDANFIYKLT